MKVILGYGDDGKPLIILQAETMEELDTLTIFASFDEIGITWDQHPSDEDYAASEGEG